MLRFRSFFLVIGLSMTCADSASAAATFDAARLSEVRKGQTTVADVVRLFGRPNFMSTNWDGTRTAAYAHAEGRSSAAMLLPAMGAALSGSGAGADTVVFYFDAQGVVTDYKTALATSAPAQAPPPPSARQDAPVASAPDVSAASVSAPAAPGKAKQPPPKASQREDGLPWWLPSSAERHDRP